MNLHTCFPFESLIQKLLLNKWSDRFVGVDAVKAVLPKTDDVIGFTRFLQAKFGVALPAN